MFRDFPCRAFAAIVFLKCHRTKRSGNIPDAGPVSLKSAGLPTAAHLFLLAESPHSAKLPVARKRHPNSRGFPIDGMCIRAYSGFRSQRNGFTFPVRMVMDTIAAEQDIKTEYIY